MFDKLLYWKRRKEGKRGQGDKIKPVLGVYQERTKPKRTSKKMRRLGHAR